MATSTGVITSSKTPQTRIELVLEIRDLVDRFFEDVL